MTIIQPNSTLSRSSKKKIAVIGGGIIGSITTWYLTNNGQDVVLIDPALKEPINRFGMLNGSSASLGVLMGHVYRRSTGRSWQLRRRSMELWPDWVSKLKTTKFPLKIEYPLVQLASSEKEATILKNLSQDPTRVGLELLNENSFNNLSRSFPGKHFGGLISHLDGRIDPLQLQSCLIDSFNKLQVKLVYEKVKSVIRRSKLNQKRWQIQFFNGKTISSDYVVLCASMGVKNLLKPLGYTRDIEPILGQALEMHLADNKVNWTGWPAVLINQGINIIPQEANTFLLGATLEPGIHPNIRAINEMKEMKGTAPKWLKNASTKHLWYALRGRPIDRAAPILEKLEDGLIIATGHYRNGVLLAPATAEWIYKAITNQE